MRVRILILLLGFASPVLAVEPEVSFRNQILPVLSKSGCNAGACHGNLNGKGGLKLSLRGEDPVGDHLVLTRGLSGRRVDLQIPAESLLLQKATGQVPHEGGQRFAAASAEARLLRDWIATGAKGMDDKAPTLTGLSVNHARLVLVEPQERAQLVATATWSNGRKSEVTALCCFDASAVGVAQVSTSGEIIREQLGEFVVTVRYQNRQVPVRVAFLPNRPATDLSGLPVHNDIDRIVHADLSAMRMKPSALSDDATFLRRVFLDLLGITPTAEEVQTFLADAKPAKRVELIDALLKRPEYATYWGQKWADVLRAEEKSLDRKGVMVFTRWLRERIAADAPLTELARDILQARGSTYANPAANFYRAVRDPYQRAESVAQVFLGLRIGCAKCHNHPFDAWTQDDYHRFAAVFQRIGYRVLENKRTDNLDTHEFIGEQIVLTAPTGDLPHPAGGIAVPRFLGAATQDVDSTDRLGALAEWVASPQNPFLARAQANRIWAHLIGRGLVDPLDDFKATNPASNPELLDHITKVFIAGGFRMKPLIRQIVTSRVYQLSATPNDTNAADSTHFSHAIVQPMEAEQLLDATTLALGTQLWWPGYPKGTRAGELCATPQDDRRMAHSDALRFLKVFGKPERLLTCECERTDDPGVQQAFQMMTGSTVNALLRQPDNRIGLLLSAKRSDTEVLNDLYLRTLSRPPSARESAILMEHLTGATDRRSAWEDIQWGLLNSKEFLLRR